MTRRVALVSSLIASSAALCSSHFTRTRACFCFFSSRRRHTRFDCDWSSDVCSSDLRGALDPAVNVVVTLEARTESAATRGAGLVQTDDRGEFRIGRLARGSYIVSVFRPETLTMNPIGPREPERTFYPDAPTAADAETIKLDTDETRDDIDFLIAAPKPMLPPVAAVRQQLALRGGLTSMPSGAAIVRGRVVTTSGSAVS